MTKDEIQAVLDALTTCVQGSGTYRVAVADLLGERNLATIRAALQSALDTFKNTENVNVSGEQVDAVEVSPSQNVKANITCPSEIREKIGIAIGEASMCWSEPPHGVFDSARANRILEEVYQHCVASRQVKSETVDLSLLIKRPKVSGYGSEDLGNVTGWNACIDHITQNFNITRKTK